MIHLTTEHGVFDKKSYLVLDVRSAISINANKLNIHPGSLKSEEKKLIWKVFQSLLYDHISTFKTRYCIKYDGNKIISDGISSPTLSLC